MCEKATAAPCSGAAVDAIVIEQNGNAASCTPQIAREARTAFYL
jgi:hypothetical protein